MRSFRQSIIYPAICVVGLVGTFNDAMAQAQNRYKYEVENFSSPKNKDIAPYKMRVFHDTTHCGRETILVAQAFKKFLDNGHSLPSDTSAPVTIVYDNLYRFSLKRRFNTNGSPSLVEACVKFNECFPEKYIDKEVHALIGQHKDRYIVLPERP